MPGGRMPEVTAVEKALKLAKDLEAAKAAAISELLNQQEEIQRQLATLGYEVQPAKGKKQTRQRDPNAPCSVCNFVTIPPHDGRVHRAQGDKKKPFTEKELSELGYKKK